MNEYDFEKYKYQKKLKDGSIVQKEAYLLGTLEGVEIAKFAKDQFKRSWVVQDNDKLRILGNNFEVKKLSEEEKRRRLAEKEKKKKQANAKKKENLEKKMDLLKTKMAKLG